jgi:hypothetical protein
MFYESLCANVVRLFTYSLAGRICSHSETRIACDSHIAPLSLPTYSRLLGLLRLHTCITAISLYYHMHGTISCLIWVSLETRTLYL